MRHSDGDPLETDLQMEVESAPDALSDFPRSHSVPCVYVPHPFCWPSEIPLGPTSPNEARTNCIGLDGPASRQWHLGEDAWDRSGEGREVTPTAPIFRSIGGTVISWHPMEGSQSSG